MTTAIQLALCSALAIATSDADDVPEWLHLLPAGEVRTQDKRGPYVVKDVEALMAASLPSGSKLVLDENHSTDLAAPKGGEAPARGWIVELQAREDGVWGRVEWTAKGRRLVAEREYRGISPVIAHLKDKTIVAIRRASLVNQPNLEGLTALHSEENGMNFMQKLAAALGLGEDATEEDILAAIAKATEAEPAEEAVQAALQSALTPIGTALGLKEGVSATAIVAGITALKEEAEPGSEVISSLQAELADVTTQLNAVQDERKREKAEIFVDNAIAEGRIGVKPLRERYITMHMADPAAAEEMVKAVPAVGHRRQGGGNPAPIRSADLDATDRSVIALMGIDAEEFKKTRATELGETQEAL